MDTWLLLIIFNVFVLGLLALDLGVLNRREHIIHFREALINSILYIILALIFGVGIYHFRGSQAGLEYLTGYLIEKSLSIDNLFVISMIFMKFGIKQHYQQHRILFWGVLGALIMRGLMIGMGTLLLSKFHWLIYVFGSLLIYTGVKMVWVTEPMSSLEEHPLTRWLKTYFPKLSPFLMVVIMVEAMDIIFAIDSIPAIFAITTDPFIIYTSNVFAILGLRSLYFVVATFLDRFFYLKYGLAAIMVFIGMKMLLSHYVVIPIEISLSITFLLILGSGIMSWFKPTQSSS